MAVAMVVDTAVVTDMVAVGVQQPMDLVGVMAKDMVVLGAVIGLALVTMAAILLLTMLLR